MLWKNGNMLQSSSATNRKKYEKEGNNIKMMRAYGTLSSM